MVCSSFEMPFVALAAVERRLLHISFDSSFWFWFGISEVDDNEEDEEDEEAEEDDEGCGVNGRLEDAVCGRCSTSCSVFFVFNVDARRSICFFARELLLIFVLEKSWVSSISRILHVDLRFDHNSFILSIWVIFFRSL